MKITCKICGHNEFSVIRDTLRYDVKRKVLKCKKCEFVFLEPIELSESFYATKKYRATYGPNLKKSSTSKEAFEIYSPFQEPIVKEIKYLLKKNLKILDVGCSTGHFLNALKGKVGTRVGLELSQDEATFIRDNLDFKVYSEPIENVEIKEGPFGLITCLQVLEHIDDPLTFLQNIKKNLKKDGYLYLELPNIDDVMIKDYKVAGYENFYYREPHVSYFSIKTLKRLLEKAGFRGTFKTVQRYNFVNHLSWLLTGKPQDNFVIGNSIPVLVSNAGANPKVKKALNSFIKKADEDYRALIGRLNLGESITFLGKQK